METLKKRLPLMGIAVLVILAMSIPLPAFANAAAPPSLVIIVQNPPHDLSIELKGKVHEQGRLIRRAWEGYYAFYGLSVRSGETYLFEVKTGDRQFTCSFTLGSAGDGTSEVSSYDNYYELDLQTQQLTRETTPWRTLRAAALRVLLTLVLEALVFFAFGFRKRASWIAFFAINLVTQIWLNSLLTNLTLLFQGSLGYGLFAGEFVVFIVEIVAFSLIVREKPHDYGWLYRAGYAFVANFASLLLGAFIFTLLPV
jgi:hypothetical protein